MVFPHFRRLFFRSRSGPGFPGRAVRCVEVPGSPLLALRLETDNEAEKWFRALQNAAQKAKGFKERSERCDREVSRCFFLGFYGLDTLLYNVI